MRPASSALEVASALALEAGARIQTLRESPLIRQRKADHSLVTNADHEADRIIRSGLRRAFPDHAILTEESGLDGPPDSEYLWVVDPVDGTRAYAKGVTGYSVMIGLMKGGKPIVGVVYDPLEDDLYEAALGEGTFYTSKDMRKKVRVSARRDWVEMPVITSTGFPPVMEKSLRPHLPGPWIPAVNSVGVKIGYVARGTADIYINHHHVHYWDTCAPQIILEEAGGTITFWDGTPLTYDFKAGLYLHENRTLASNGLMHEEVLKILAIGERSGDG